MAVACEPYVVAQQCTIAPCRFATEALEIVAAPRLLSFYLKSLLRPSIGGRDAAPKLLFVPMLAERPRSAYQEALLRGIPSAGLAGEAKIEREGSLFRSRAVRSWDQGQVARNDP
jgi:hypothetical protein